MPIISKEMLEEWLTGKVTKDESRVKVTQKKSGPGEYSIWRYIGGVNAFQQREAQGKKNPRKKIIFSNAILGFLAPSNDDIELMDALIQHYDLYIWPGKDMPFTEARPIRDSHLFWQERKKLVGATKNQVKEALMDQGMNSDEFIQIDLSNYTEMTAKLKNSSDTYLPGIRFGANGINIYNLDELDQAMNSSDAFEHIVLDAKKSKAFRERYPNKKIDLYKSDSLYIKNIQEGGDFKDSTIHIIWLKEKNLTVLDRLQSASIHISNCSFDKLIVPKRIHHSMQFRNCTVQSLDTSSADIKYLLLDKVQPLTEFKVSPFIKRLSFSHSHLQSPLRIDQFKYLSTLEITSTANVDISRGNPTLKKLTLNNIALKEIDFSKYPNLETLELKNIDFQLKNLAKLTKLKKLIILNVADLKTIDLAMFPDLIEIDCPEQFIINPSKMTQANFTGSNADLKLMPNLLEGKILVRINEKFVDVSQIPLTKTFVHSRLAYYESDFEVRGRNAALQSLTLHHLTETVTLNLDQMPSLNNLAIVAKTIKINGIGRGIKTLKLNNLLMESIDLNMFPDLESLSIGTCANLKFIHGSFSKLKHITLLDCPNIQELDLRSAPNLNSAVLTLNLEKDSFGIIQRNKTPIPAIKWPKKLRSLELDGYHCPGNALDINDLPDVEFLKLQQMKIDTLTSKNLNNIKGLTLNLCPVLHLDLRNFNHLIFLEANNVNSITLPDVSTLKTITLKSCAQLNALNFSACKELEYLYINNTLMDYFDLTQCQQIQEVMIISSMDSKQKIEINCRECKKLRVLEVRAESQPIEIDLKDCKDFQYLELITKASHNQIENAEQSTYFSEAVVASPDFRRMKAKLKSFNLPYLTVYRSNESGDHSQAESSQSLQNYINQCSKVEIFDYGDSEKIDGNTAKDLKPRVASGVNKLTLYSRQNFIRDHYRINNADKVKYEKGEISFDETADDLTSAPHLQTHPTIKADEVSTNKLMAEADNDLELVVGLLEAHLTDNKPKVIPTLHPMHKGDIEIYTDPLDAVNILWSEAKQAFYFQTKNSTIKNVKILYKYKHKNETINQLHVVTQKDLLSPQLVSTLKKRLHFNGSKVEFLFDPHLSKNQKMDKLKDYISKFNDDDLNGPINHSVDALCESILQGQGVCRHRARAFMLLAHLIDVPAKKIRNPDHQFCEVPYVGKNGTVWSRVDLGGAEMLDLTPEHVRENPFDKLLAKRIGPLQTVPNPNLALAMNAAAEASAMKPPKAKPDAVLVAYEKMFDEMVAERAISNTWELLEKPGKLPPLFMLDASQDPLLVNKQILKHLSARDPYTYSKHIFISEPSELDSFLQPRYFANGRYGYEKNSQLRHMMMHGGILVIDWSHFTPAQIAGYSTLIDKDKTLLGEAVSKDLLVMGLVKPDTEGCGAFHSRCQPIKLTADFLKPLPSAKVTNSVEANAKLEVDLFHSISWRELLLGNTVSVNSQVQLAEGPLVKAIKEGKKLLIYNPPDDPDFNLLMHRVLDERKVLLNGKLLWVPPQLEITITTKPHVSKLQNVTITTVADTHKNHMPLGLDNIHEYYQLLEIKDKKAIPKNGLLDRYQSDKDVIYISGYIPEYEWQRLLDEINTKYPTTSFKFQLAPGAEIENVAVNNAKSEPKKVSTLDATELAIISSDPDLTTNMLAKQLVDPLLIDMTPNMSISDLLYEQTQTETGYEGEVEFNHIEKDALKALREGRDVILNGAINESLFQQLLPLLDLQTKLIQNGEEVELDGNLYLVSPLSAKEQFSQIESAKIEYGSEDYLPHFNVQDHPLVKRIIEFHFEAMKLPSGELGIPANIPLSLQKIKQLLAAVKTNSPIHPANPIKHVFNYDYPVKSDEYAYLNVLGKYYFANTASRVNERKLHELNALYDFSHKENVRLHIWKILNCLSVPMIHQLLKHKEASSSALPTISAQGLDEVMTVIKPYLAHVSVKERNGPEKQIKQIHQLLEDPDTFLILLKGAPGIGKTRTLMKSLGHCFQGENDIEKFLLEGGNIIFDEANMATPAFWDFLKGLSKDRKSVYYRGKEYSLMADTKKRPYKVIITGNPENFPGRYHHALFQEYGKTVYFKMPPHHYLENVIMKNILAESKQDTPKVMQAVLKIYAGIEKINPNLYCSIRDLENVCLRYVALLRLHPTSDHPSLLMKACRYEFLDGFKDPEHKVLFEKLLEETLQVKHKAPAKPELIYITPSHPVPNSQLNLIEAIDCQLTMRREMQRNGASTAGSMKRCIILEGESGIGKSRLFVKMLKRRIQDECKGKSKEEAEKIAQAWDYVQINGATRNVRQVLIDAFYAGKPVILNEINLDNTHEKLLNQLLDGNDEEIKDHEKPKHAREAALAKLSDEERKAAIAEMKRIQQTMIILASQNPGSYAGRVANSQALRNRSSFHYVDLSEADMVLLSNSFFVDVFKKVKSVNPRVNRRHFFEGIRAERKASKRPRI